jgi:TolA-binding protein
MPRMSTWPHRLLLSTASAALLVLPGCIYPADRGRALETRVDRLEGENQNLRAELQKTKDELLPRIDEKVAEVTAALESLDRASRRSGADNAVLLQKTLEDVAALRGQLEAQLFQLAELRSTLQRLDAETEAKVLAMLGPEAAKQWEARKKLQELERPDEPKPFLELADTRARAGEAQVARRLYDEFVRRWPKHELTGEAHFGMGELWAREEKCREALFEYGKVIQDHPKSRSAPAAYLRSSDCFARLKMADESRLALEELVKAHPGSEAGKTARARLAELDKKKAPPKRGGR